MISPELFLVSKVVDTQFGSGGQKRWNNETAVFIRGTTTSAQVVSKTTFKNLVILSVDNTFSLPREVADTLCKPLVAEAPNGLTKPGPAPDKTDPLDTVNTDPSITVSIRSPAQYRARADCLRVKKLFAPIDSAFEGCENYSTDQLKSTLENLVLKSILFSPYFPSKSSVTALSGNKLNFETENGNKYVSCGSTKAKILRSDVTTENGVIHVIDALLEC